MSFRSEDKVRLVALNEKRSGRLGGVRGADLLCQRDAERSNIEGTFRAFLPAVSHPNEKDILSAAFPFTSNSNPIVNLKGELLFSSWDNMLETGGLFASSASLFSFDGQDIGQKR